MELEDKKKRLEIVAEQMLASQSIPAMLIPIVRTYLSSALQSLSSEEQIDALISNARDILNFIETGETN